MIAPLLPLCNYIFAGWQFFVAFDLQLYSVFDDDLQGICSCSMAMLITTLATGQTHQKYLWIFIFYSQKFNLLASHRSHKSHRGASLRPRLLASPSVFSRMAHASLRCVLREICEICVKLNHLCELFLVRLPCPALAKINYSPREDKSFSSRE